LDTDTRHPSDRQAGLPTHERHFYSRNRAIGRFGVRLFKPQLMEVAHWHGHIELNFSRGADLHYDFNGQAIRVPAGECAAFWAGVPHQLVGVERKGEVEPLLGNLYLPVDSFLLMSHVGHLQVALLSGAIVAIRPELCNAETLDRWYRDYRSGSFERVEVVKMELNVLFRRVLLEPGRYIVPPKTNSDPERSLSSTHIRHVVEMVRFILEHLDKPLRNRDITAATGLHENYAITLFTRVMHIPPRQFLARMRLMRARALLVESTMAIPAVVEASGFTSISQFYHRFREAYGVSPREMRDRYVRMTL
jgi:AraC family transcriptional regulator, melibiose operon regulatory protein